MIRREIGLIVFATLVGAAGATAQDGAGEQPPVLEVSAVDYEFQTTTTEVPAGWTTVALHNEGEETHTLEFARIPNEGSYREVSEFFGVFDTLRVDLEEGAIDSATFRKVLKSHTPAWFSDMEYRSGPGLVAPGRTARTTVDLEPGTYLALCYVADSAGTFHYARGMRSEFTVTEPSNGASPPAADVELTVAGYEISTEGELSTGEQTVAVHFGERENPQEEPFQDVQLVRLEEGMTVKDLAEWDISAPAPAEFLGGAPSMAAGNTAYVTVDLEPGRYAWVSSSTDEKEGMKKVFTVK